MTQANKDQLLTVRMRHKDYVDFAIAAEMEGMTPSSLIHSYIHRMIREKRTEDPGAFDYRRAAIEKRIADRSQAKKQSAKVSRQKQFNQIVKDRLQEQ
jgi:hypothetical protein